MKTKRYSRPVFSGKEVPFVGIAEGHGILYRGNTVEFSMNLTYKGSIETREGCERDDEFDGTIHVAASVQSRALCEGTNLWGKSK